MFALVRVFFPFSGFYSACLVRAYAETAALVFQPVSVVVFAFRTFHYAVTACKEGAVKLAGVCPDTVCARSAYHFPVVPQSLYRPSRAVGHRSVSVSFATFPFTAVYCLSLVFHHAETVIFSVQRVATVYGVAADNRDCMSRVSRAADSYCRKYCDDYR